LSVDWGFKTVQEGLLISLAFCFFPYDVVGRCVSCTKMWYADVFFLHYSVVPGQMCFMHYNVVGRCVSCATMWWADVFHALQCGGQMCFMHYNVVGRCVSCTAMQWADVCFCTTA